MEAIARVGIRVSDRLLDYFNSLQIIGYLCRPQVRCLFNPSGCTLLDGGNCGYFNGPLIPYVLYRFFFQFGDIFPIVFHVFFLDRLLGWAWIFFFQCSSWRTAGWFGTTEWEQFIFTNIKSGRHTKVMAYGVYRHWCISTAIHNPITGPSPHPHPHYCLAFPTLEIHIPYSPSCCS